MRGVEAEVGGGGPRLAASEERPPRRSSQPRAAPRPAARLAGLTVAAIPVAAVLLFGAVEDEHALPIEAAALVIGAGSLLARARRGARPLPAPRVTLPVLLLVALPAIQLVPLPPHALAVLSPRLAEIRPVVTTLSVHPYATGGALLRWLAYAAFLVACLELLRRPGAAASALTAVCGLGIAEAIYGVGNLLLGNRTLLWLPRTAYFADATGTLVNHNHYATVLVLCLFAVLARRWLARPRADPGEEHGVTAACIAGATAIGLGVLLSSSRGGMLALAAGLAISAAFASGDRESRRGRWMIAGVALLTVVYGGYVALDPVVQRFAIIGREVRGRPRLWRDVLVLAADFPVVGAGAGTFETVFPAYRERTRDQVAYAHAHQDYLELAAEGGIVGIGLAAIAAVAFWAQVGAGIGQARGRRRLALAALSGGIAGALLHAAVDFPLHVPGVVFLLILLGAIALTQARELADRERAAG